MKAVARLFLLLTLAVSLNFAFGMLDAPNATNRSTVALAETAPTTPVEEKNPCGADVSNGKSIPDTFSVGDCLTTSGQRSSQFVPKKAGQDPKNSSDIRMVIVNAISLLIKLIGALALVVFIIGALLTITSEGKSDTIEKGKTAMIMAVIGLILAFMSFVIVTFVQSILF